MIESLRVQTLTVKTVFAAVAGWPSRCLALALVAISPLCGPLLAEASDQSGGSLLGAAWYPEQWPETRWEEDLGLMEQAHLHVVRVGEFAWSRMEPAEGRYDLDWLERAVRLAEKHHIAVVLGTPTDAPPAWLTAAHRETLRTDATGHLAEHGGRRQFNYANLHYRAYCAQIAGQLARRFGHDPDVIGWQIGNEYTDESFDPETRQQFQDWLKRRFGTLDALNRDWSTAYWSQTYDRWDEIPLPSAGGNPGLLLEHRHFVSDTWRDFEHVQVGAIRKFAQKRQFITTNLGGLGWSDNFDHYEINDELDLASWDDYVGQGHLNVARNGAMHDFARGWKRANFWVMETQPGSVNWAQVNNSLDRGETRAMAWQAIGHGADAVLYWQWRSALNGQEQYHGAIVGPDGEPLPLYAEIVQTGSEFERAAPLLEGTAPVAQVALLHSYDSRWAIDFQPHNRNYDQLEVLLGYYAPLREQRFTADIVSAEAPLDGYKLVLAPSLNLISTQLAARLLAYVQKGGHLVLGPRSGMKDEHNALNTERQPGPLAGPLGGRVEQFYAIEEPVPVSGAVGTGSALVWAEQLSTRPDNTRPDNLDKDLDKDLDKEEVLLRYGKANGWLDGQPAMISRRVGQGRITYLGAVLDPALMRSALQWMIAGAHLEPEFGPVPADVEVCRRVGQDRTNRDHGGKQRTIYVLINHGASAAHVALPGEMRDALRDWRNITEVTLDPQGVAVLEAAAP